MAAGFKTGGRAKGTPNKSAAGRKAALEREQEREATVFEYGASLTQRMAAEHAQAAAKIADDPVKAHRRGMITTELARREARRTEIRDAGVAQIEKGQDQHVYVLEGVDGRCKIGKAIDVEYRVKQLQTGHPGRIKLHFALPMPIQLASMVERDAHYALRAVRFDGEWFSTTPAQAIEAVKACADRLSRGIRDGAARAALACIKRYENTQEELAFLNSHLELERKEWSDREGYLLRLIAAQKAELANAEVEFLRIGGSPALWKRKVFYWPGPTTDAAD